VRKGREKGREGEGREGGKVASWLLEGWTPLHPLVDGVQISSNLPES